MLSVLWELDELLGLATAVAVCEACEGTTAISCRIKWPNDVWAGDRKVAGILVEARPQERWAVIGIGLNVDTSEQQFEPQLRRTATSLRIESGARVDRDRALDALLASLAKWFGELGEQRAGVLDAYRRLAIRHRSGDRRQREPDRVLRRRRATDAERGRSSLTGGLNSFR
jgi:biotin-(acetyl-CoA carboxylase) ligase